MLCIAQVSFRKGIVYLLKALELIRKKGFLCELTLVGKIEPAYEPVIAGYLRGGLPVNHIDHIENTMVYDLMTKHDLFIIPSIEDGFGIVVSEALSVHLPAIVSRNCGASEIIAHGANGFVIEAFSETQIAEAVIRSIEYHFDFSSPIPTWKEYAAELDRFYNEILLN